MSSKRIKSIRIFDIEAFIATAESGSQKEAAKSLGCDQSTISLSIMKLEEWSGLFLTTEDVPRKITAVGEKFLPIARKVIDLLENAKADLRLVKPAPVPRKSGRDIVIDF